MTFADERFVGFPNAAKAARKAARGKLSTREKKEQRRQKKMAARFAQAGQSLEEVRAQLVHGRIL